MRELNGRDPYELLGVDRAADSTEISSAYRLLIKQAHPDMPSGDEELAKLLTLARDVLLDPTRRREYDRLSEDGTDTDDEPAQASAWDEDDVVAGATASPNNEPSRRAPPSSGDPSPAWWPPNAPRPPRPAPKAPPMPGPDPGYRPASRGVRLASKTAHFFGCMVAVSTFQNLGLDTALALWLAPITVGIISIILALWWPSPLGSHGIATVAVGALMLLFVVGARGLGFQGGAGAYCGALVALILYEAFGAGKRGKI